MTRFPDWHVGGMKSIFVHLSNSKHGLLIIASPIQPKLRFAEKKQSNLPRQSSKLLQRVTIQNQPTLKTKRADYLGLAAMRGNSYKSGFVLVGATIVKELWN